MTSLPWRLVLLDKLDYRCRLARELGDQINRVMIVPDVPEPRVPRRLDRGLDVPGRHCLQPHFSYAIYTFALERRSRCTFDLKNLLVLDSLVSLLST